MVDYTRDIEVNEPPVCEWEGCNNSLTAEYELEIGLCSQHIQEHDNQEIEDRTHPDDQSG